MTRATQKQISIDDYLAGEIELFSPPEVLLRVNSLLDDPTKDATHLAQVLEQDPAISSRLLKIVNSAFYSFPATISSISQALTILGSNEVRLLVLSSSAIEKFSQLPNTPLQMKQFWTHSLNTALYAKFLAENHPKKRQLSAVFMSGLLHDIGRIILYSKAPELARSSALLASAEQINDTEAEDRTFGFNHAELGAALLKMWKIPSAIHVAIQHHHNYLAAEEHIVETRLVYLANLLANTNVKDEKEFSANISPENTLWDAIDIPYSALPSIIESAKSEFGKTYSLFFAS